MIIVFVCCCYLCLYDIKMCSVYERAFFMLFGQLGMLFEFIFFLIILIRNPLEYMDGIISFFIGIVRFWGPPTSDLSSIVLDGKWIKRLLFSCDNFFFFIREAMPFSLLLYHGEHISFFLVLFFLRARSFIRVIYSVLMIRVK